MASTGTGCFVVSYRFFSGGSNRQSLSAHLTMGGHGGVRYQPVIYNFENYEFCAGEYSTSFKLWRLLAHETRGRHFHSGQQICNQITNLFSTCCSLLGSDNCSEDEKFVSIGRVDLLRIYSQSNEEEINSMLIFF